MKSLRIGFALLAVGSLFVARLSGRREFFLLFFMLAATLLYGILLNLWTILSFSFVQEIAEKKVVKGSQVELRIGVYNGKPFPFTRMGIEVDTPLPAKKEHLAFTLSPGGHIHYTIPLHCAYRGSFKVGMTLLELGDIFGLVKIRWDMRHLPYYRQRELTILPRLTDLPFLPAGARDAKGGSGAPRPTPMGDDFAQLRRYQPGDRLTRIHWPASARVREPMVKTYEQPGEDTAFILLDTACPYPGEDALRYADLACECAAALTYYHLRAGHTVQLAISETGRPPEICRSRQEFVGLYHRLATLPFGKGDSLEEALASQLSRKSGLKAVYLLTSQRDPAALSLLERLSRERIGVHYFLLLPHPQAKPDTGLSSGVPLRTLVFGQDIATGLAEQEGAR